MDFTDDADTTNASETVVDTSPPPADRATLEDVEQYGLEVMKSNPRQYSHDLKGDKQSDDPTMSLPTAKELGGDPNYKSEFPWLFDPTKGVMWDFDPIELRVLSQENAWVGMLVSSIVKEISETSWTITESEGQRETQKRLSTHPDERETIDKELPDTWAEDIYALLSDPNPDDDWHDLVQMIMADALEIGRCRLSKRSTSGTTRRMANSRRTPKTSRRWHSSRARRRCGPKSTRIRPGFNRAFGSSTATVRPASRRVEPVALASRSTSRLGR